MKMKDILKEKKYTLSTAQTVRRLRKDISEETYRMFMKCNGDRNTSIKMAKRLKRNSY